MAKGTVTLTLEMPLEVAEWLAANGERIGTQAHFAASKARFATDVEKTNREERFQQRKKELEDFGRTGFRELRKHGVRTNFQKNRETLKAVAPQFGVPWQTFELAVSSFKRKFDQKLRNRRDREVARLYEAGTPNKDIARQLRISIGTVDRAIRTYRKSKTWKSPALAKGNTHSLGAIPGTPTLASQPLSWEALKNAGRRA